MRGDGRNRWDLFTGPQEEGGWKIRVLAEKNWTKSKDAFGKLLIQSTELVLSVVFPPSRLLPVFAFPLINAWLLNHLMIYPLQTLKMPPQKQKLFSSFEFDSIFIGVRD